MIYCDGASSGNPGNSGVGVVIISNNKIYKLSEYIGVATNNFAEYSALIRGLEEASVLGAKRIKIFLDAELLVKQLKGLYRVKSQNLWPLWRKVQILLKGFDSYELNHIPRELNREADSLAKAAIPKHRDKAGEESDR
ncbi:MAG: ribonuclease HI family protein [Nitrospirae bacterium]|nr:ribonuclease HI family protein [Nitrospirota bacterium]